VKGFGWEWCKLAWSKNGRKYTIDELADHLSRIIKEERGHKIPHEPVINVPKRLNLPILGMQTDDVKTLDGQYVVDENKFKMNAQKTWHERVLKGEGSIHASMQSWFPPALCDFFNQRIDVLAKFHMPDKSKKNMRWCQGEVTEVCEKQNTVKVCWDPIPDCTGWEMLQETYQILLPSKWNKDVNGAWRMDLSIEFEDLADEEIEQEFNPNQSVVEMSECESESDSSSCAGSE
jgi:hypothetical protein